MHARGFNWDVSVFQWVLYFNKYLFQLEHLRRMFHLYIIIWRPNFSNFEQQQFDTLSLFNYTKLLPQPLFDPTKRHTKNEQNERNQHTQFWIRSQVWAAVAVIFKVVPVCRGVCAASTVIWMPYRRLRCHQPVCHRTSVFWAAALAVAAALTWTVIWWTTRRTMMICSSNNNTTTNTINTIIIWALASVAVVRLWMAVALEQRAD